VEDTACELQQPVWVMGVMCVMGNLGDSPAHIPRDSDSNDDSHRAHMACSHRQPACRSPKPVQSSTLRIEKVISAENGESQGLVC